MKPKSDLSLIINTRYASQFLSLALDSYDKYSDLDNELIVIADRPSWQTLKVLQERKLYYYVVNYCNLDMADNYGAYRATRKYVGFINDDVFFGPHWDSVLMDSMNSYPHSMGGLFRVESNTGFSCGYDPKIGIHSFSEKLFLRALKEIKKYPIKHGIGAPTCVSKKDFLECFGLTFHLSYGQGHERQLESRMVRRYPGANSYVSTKTGIFHFSCAGNRDRMFIHDYKKSVDGIVSYEDGKEDRNIRDGLYLCFGCGKRVWPKVLTGKSCTVEDQEVWKRGYWLCPECKKKNGAPKPHWMPWNQFL